MGDVANRTVYCVERDCDFSTTLGPGCLTEHCIDEHQWGRYPCEFENCKFVSYSKEWFFFGQSAKVHGVPYTAESLTEIS